LSQDWFNLTKVYMEDFWWKLVSEVSILSLRIYQNFLYLGFSSSSNKPYIKALIVVINLLNKRIMKREFLY
jgi:hypothetical protein